jgi:hypothetical protein
MHPSRMTSRYSIFNFRNLCEIAGFNPDGSLRESNRHSISEGAFNQHPASDERIAVFSIETRILAD